MLRSLGGGVVGVGGLGCTTGSVVPCWSVIIAYQSNIMALWLLMRFSSILCLLTDVLSSSTLTVGLVLDPEFKEPKVEMSASNKVPLSTLSAPGVVCPAAVSSGGVVGWLLCASSFAFSFSCSFKVSSLSLCAIRPAGGDH